MANKQKRRRYCIFKTKNRQEQYAHWMQQVEYLESGGVEYPPGFKFCPFQIVKDDEIMGERPHQWIQVLTVSQNSVTEMKSTQFLDESLKTFQSRGISLSWYYIFAIDFSGLEDELTNIQYFVLLLQMYPQLKNRLAACFTYKGNDRESQYFRLSDYLIFLQRKYQAFFWLDAEKQEIRQLRKTTPGIQNTFWPLIEIDSDTLEKVRSRREVCYDGQTPEFSRLYETLSFTDCDNKEQISTPFISISNIRRLLGYYQK